MSLFESNTQAFILRIWLEPRAAEESGYEWRGVIEHLPTGERHYFLDLEEIPALIQPYLPFKRPSTRSKRNFKRWLKQWKFSSHRKRD